MHLKVSEAQTGVQRVINLIDFLFIVRTTRFAYFELLFTRSSLILEYYM